MIKIHRAVSLCTCVTAFLLASQAQTPTTFTVTPYAISNGQPRNVYAVDLNNDGIADLVRDATVDTTGHLGFTIDLAKGDGSFIDGPSYTFGMPTQGTTPMAFGDFNGDGNGDLVFELAGTNQLAVYLGNGNGTMQAPLTATIALPTGQHFGGNPIVAADFTGDGKTDLITEGNTDTLSVLYLIPGQGNGRFGTPVPIYTAPANNGAGYQIGAGDFDGDGKADVAFLQTYNCAPGNCASILHVMYGNGAGAFTDSTPYTNSNLFLFGVGDLNSDGKSDLFAGVGISTQQLTVLYGQGSRTFTLYTQPLGSATSGSYVEGLNAGGNLAMADFNGDGRMDLVGIGGTSATELHLVVFLANTTPGSFTPQQVSVPWYQSFVAPIVGFFNKDNKPDVVFIGQTSSTDTRPYIVDAINTTAASFAGCYPFSGGQSIRLCSPATGSTASPVHFVASAKTFVQLRKMEVWIDGVKRTEQWHTWGQQAWFDSNIPVAAGLHSASIFAVDIDNHVQGLVISSFNANNCTAPNSPGVRLCTPGNGLTVGSPVNVTASATVTGFIQRMELWVDGLKQYTSFSSTALGTSVNLSPGSHRFTVIAVNTQGQKWSTVSTVTVQ